MKTLELKLKKGVFIVDTNAPLEAIEIDDYEFLCKGSEFTEEIASELVDFWQNMANDGFIYENYKTNLPKKKTASESFISAVESKGFYWLENPYDKSINVNSDISNSMVRMVNKVKYIEQWKEAEEKTFRNPLVFVKNA